MRARIILLGTATTLLSVLQAPASAATSTTIDVSQAIVSGADVAISGTISFGDDLLGPTTVGTDPAGDVPLGPSGLDLTSLSIGADLAARTITVSLGLAETVQHGPFNGFEIAFKLDGMDRLQWLGGGTAGSGWYPPSTGPWVGLCNNQSGGYRCDAPLPGTVAPGQVTWQVPFAVPAGGTIGPGSIIEPGSVFCGPRPCSFTWAVVAAGAGGTAPIDRMEPWSPYLVPGHMLLGIAPAGTPEHLVEYEAEGTLDIANGSFAGSLSAPPPGAHRVFVKTCAGVSPALACAVGTRDITIPSN